MKELRASVKRILVVEDEQIVSNVFQRVLTAEGFKVDIAIDGKIAIDMIEEKQYDLCLIDIRTPAMSGKELYLWLEEKHPRLANRVLFTTGDLMGGDTLGFLAQSGRPFLPKPFSLDELKAIMREALQDIERSLRCDP